MRNPSQSYGASLAIWDHTVLPATQHKWTCPAITPAKQAGTRFTYLGSMEGWVDLGSLTAAQPGIEPTTAWSKVDALTVTPPCHTVDRNHIGVLFYEESFYLTSLLGRNDSESATKTEFMANISRWQQTGLSHWHIQLFRHNQLEQRRHKSYNLVNL